jgi:hypothetical protein
MLAKSSCSIFLAEQRASRSIARSSSRGDILAAVSDDDDIERFDRLEHQSAALRALRRLEGDVSLLMRKMDALERYVEAALKTRPDPPPPGSDDGERKGGLQ